MLVEFCGGYIDPERVEAIMPAVRGGYALVTRGRNIVVFEADADELGEGLVKAGLVLPELQQEGADHE